MDKTSLGDRMKGYETVTSLKLIPRTPVIIRIDGKAFHTITKQWKCEQPYDSRLHNSMVGAMRSTAAKIQNCVFAYTQSDEVSFLLKDWNTFTSQQWFGGKLQKITSVSASLFTSQFLHNAFTFALIRPDSMSPCNLITNFDGGLFPAFDARAFNIPMEEVTNYFIWRQQDASRNSVQMLGRAHFSHKQLYKKSNSDIQDMLMKEHGVNWNDMLTWQKRGSCATMITDVEDGFEYTKMVLDEEPPIFTKDRDYIERHLSADE